MSCAERLKGTTASITPVSPPRTKIARKPPTKSSGARHPGRPVQSVAIQLITWMPLGTAMPRLAAAVMPSASVERPVANMWWIHKVKLRIPVPTIDRTISRYPTTGRRAKVWTTWDTIPAAGRNMM